jgi:hypothetical protein
MPGLVPGIHVLAWNGPKGVDGRVKPGHDEMGEANKYPSISLSFRLVGAKSPPHPRPPHPWRLAVDRNGPRCGL